MEEYLLKLPDVCVCDLIPIFDGYLFHSIPLASCTVAKFDLHNCADLRFALRFTPIAMRVNRCMRSCR